MKSGWDAPLTDWLVEIREFTNKEILALSTDAVNRIKMRTPSVTGTLRAGWYMTQLMNEGIISVVISNDVEYVVFVEYGTHKMAGRHMVEQTLNELAEGTM